MADDDTKFDQRFVPLAASLRELMNKRGITQNDLAEKAGLHPAQISNFLNQKRGLRLPSLAAAAEALGAKLALVEDEPALKAELHRGGEVVFLEGVDQSPPYFIRVEAPVGDWQAGDLLRVLPPLDDPNHYKQGQWIVVMSGYGFKRLAPPRVVQVETVGDTGVTHFRNIYRDHSALSSQSVIAGRVDRVLRMLIDPLPEDMVWFDDEEEESPI